MRRFLGANLHINTGASTEDNQQAGATSLSSTKRAFQNTFGQLSRGNSSNTGSSKTSPNPSYQQYDHTHTPPIASPSSNSSSSSPLPVNSPVPPTPPSKHGHEEDSAAAEEYDDSSWDDAFKLPFGSSSTSSSALSRASSSASSAANPYDGVIDRTSSIAGASVHERTTTAVGDEEDGDHDDDNNDLTRAGHRTSTATISASRANIIASPPPLQSSTSTSVQYTNTHQSATSNSNNNSNSRGLAVSAMYAANASSLVDLKDEMMLELLSSDALIHVAQFEILGFDEVEELRKEHSILNNRLQSLQSKLLIETKIRDAALSISRLYATKRLSLRQKQAAEEELKTADKKVDHLNNELNKLFRREMEIKNRINRHMAAVLALSFRKLESSGSFNTAIVGTPAISFGASRSGAGSRNGFYPLATSNGANLNGKSTAPSSVASSHTGPYTPLSPTFPSGSFNNTKSSTNPSTDRQDLLSPNALYSPTFSTGSSASAAARNKTVQAFEGPHFFANNKDAIVPGSIASTSTSASMSPSTSNHPNAPLRSPSFTQLALFTSSSALRSSHSHHAPSLSIPKSPTPSSFSNAPLPSPALSTNSTTLGYMDTSGLETQLADMTSQLNQSKTHAVELQNTIDLLKAEKKDLSLRLEELARNGSKENESSSRQLNDSQDEIRQLKDELAKAQARIDENIKDASLWEEQSRKLRDDFENERRDMAARLKSTLSKYSNDARSTLGKYLPDSNRIQSLDISDSLSRYLEDILGSMDEAHSRLLDENTTLQDQLAMHKQTSQQTSSQNANEVQLQQRRVDQLQQEKQVLMKKITRIESENLEIKSSLKELSDEHGSVNARYAALQERHQIQASEHSALQQQYEMIASKHADLQERYDTTSSKHAALQERYDASASQQLDSERRMAQKIQEVDKVHTERMHEKEKALASADQDKRSIRSRLESLQIEVQEVRNEKNAFVQQLLEIWKNMPSESAIQARLALKDTDDVMKFIKAVYLSTASSAQSNDSEVALTPEKLAQRVQGILESDGKIISRLAAHEDHAASHKAASIRAEKLLQESKISLQAYSNQVKELEERLSKMNDKEVEMLERLNDLSIALENARANTKKTELNVQNLEKKCVALEKEKEGLNKKIVVLEKEKEKLSNKHEHKAKIASLEKEVADLKEELASAQDELDELRTRESKQRVQLLDELTQLTEEASSLRAQLRTAQRKLSAVGR